MIPILFIKKNWRKILYTISVLVVLFQLNYCKTKTPTKKELNVRKDSKDLTKEEWDQLRLGIKLMKIKSVEDRFDPHGYYFQANIHGWDKYDGSEKANDIADKLNWHRCQHGHYFFLVWHRMYLFHFEKIMQKVTGNASLTIPYWNYYDPDDRTLPEPFRLPADTQLNPLYVIQRCRAINSGMPFKAELVDPSPALSTLFFTVNETVDRFQFCHTFAGAKINAPKYSSDRQGLLERIPHDMIHMFVGGPGGYMSDECKTARDPIFWFHHSTIDRIWESWKLLGDTPLNDEKYLNQTFDFYNINGEKKGYKVRDFLDTIRLGYRYDKLMMPSTKIKRNLTKVPLVRITGKQKSPDKLEVSPSHLTIPLDLDKDTLDLFEAMAKSPDHFEDIRFSFQVNFNYIESELIYNMHMNLPENSYPFDNKPYFIGSLVYFRAKCVPPIRREVLNVRKCYDVTENVKSIVRRNYIYSGEYTKSINITFVPKSCDDIILSKKELSDSYITLESKSFIRFNEIHLLHYSVRHD